MKLVVTFALLVMLPLVAMADQKSEIRAGSWETREVRIVAITSECRYVEVVSAQLDLAADINYTVVGHLSRNLMRSWWVAGPTCVLPERENKNPNLVLRQDGWIVRGEPAGDGLRLKGVYSGCVNDCEQRFSAPKIFDVTIFRKTSAILEGQFTEIVNSTNFRDTDASRLDSESATTEFASLIQPLLKGDCDQFLELSTDQNSRMRILRDATCEFSAAISRLLPNIIFSKPATSNSISLGRIFGQFGPLLLSDGDVLVQRFFVVDSHGGNVHIGGVLRKQANGGWKILDLVP